MNVYLTSEGASLSRDDVFDALVQLVACFGAIGGALDMHAARIGGDRLYISFN